MTDKPIIEYDDNGEPIPAFTPGKRRYCTGCDFTWTLWPGQWATAFYRGDDWFCSEDCAREFGLDVDIHSPTIGAPKGATTCQPHAS